MKLTQKHSAVEPQPNGNAFNAETLRTQRTAEFFPGARLVSSRSGIIGECRLGLSSGLPHAHLLRVGTTRAPFWLQLKPRRAFALKSH
jgi:hypothetical protein